MLADHAEFFSPGPPSEVEGEEGTESGAEGDKPTKTQRERGGGTDNEREAGEQARVCTMDG